jgi:hypothetical protein
MNTDVAIVGTHGTACCLDPETMPPAGFEAVSNMSANPWPRSARARALEVRISTGERTLAAGDALER